MIINFSCQGGFANLQIAFSVDTRELSESLSQELIDLVERSHFFELQLQQDAPKFSGPPDIFAYELTIQDANKSRAIACNDITAPPALRPLLARLQKLGLEQSSSSG